MEPVSIIGLVGSVVSIIEAITSSLVALRSLQQKWKEADLTVSLLIAQLSTLKAALNQISEWIRTSLAEVPQHHQLVIDLGTSLESCKILILFIENHVSRLDFDDAESLDFKSKVLVLLKDQSVRDSINHLNHQCIALNLLLTALNCRSLSEQKDLLLSAGSRQILDQVKDNTSSMICLRDSDSYASRSTFTTVGSSVLNVVFPFDRELFASKVYQSNMRSLIRRALRKTKGQKENNNALVSNGTLSNIKRIQVASQATVRIDQSKQKDRSEKIDQKIRIDRMREKNVVKLLLLGLSGCGKWTLLSQLQQITDGYTRDERIYYRSIVFDTIVRDMQDILYHMKSLGLPIQDQETQNHVQSIFLQPATTDNGCLLPEVLTAMKILWKDPRVYRSFCTMPRESRLYSSTAYYLDSIERIGLPDYLPTKQDIAECKPKSGAFSETKLAIGDIQYHFLALDVLQYARKKLMSLFEDMNVVIFMVDVSSYNEVTFEDESVTRLHEALTYFDSVCNSRYFSQTSIVLLLNKIDQFKEKLPVEPLKTHFPDYDGGADYSAACDYIINRFVSLNQSQTKEIYTHFMSVKNDPIGIRFIMAAVNDIIINKSLEACKAMDLTA